MPDLFGTTQSPARSETQAKKPRKTAVLKPAETFSQLQQNGVARPSPKPMPVAPAASNTGFQQQVAAAVQPYARPVAPAQPPAGGGSTQTLTQTSAPSIRSDETQTSAPSIRSNETQESRIRDALQQQVEAAMAGGTRYTTENYKQIEQAARDNINAGFDRQRDQLDETMARRGLYDSTYAAKGYQDLGGQQARATADLNAQLLKDAAETQMADRLGVGAMTRGVADIDQQTAQRTQQNAQFDKTIGQDNLDRELRSKLGISELSGRIDGQNTVARDDATARQDLARSQSLIQMLEMLGFTGEGGAELIKKFNAQSPPPSSPPNDNVDRFRQSPLAPDRSPQSPPAPDRSPRVGLQSSTDELTAAAPRSVASTAMPNTYASAPEDEDETLVEADETPVDADETPVDAAFEPTSEEEAEEEKAEKQRRKEMLMKMLGATQSNYTRNR